jgi:hypothetical protein
MKLYPDNWRFRLTTGLVSFVCIVAALLLGPVVGIHGFWPGIIAVVVAVIVGNLLGGRVYRLLFPPSSSDSPDHPPRG